MKAHDLVRLVQELQEGEYHNFMQILLSQGKTVEVFPDRIVVLYSMHGNLIKANVPLRADAYETLKEVGWALFGPQLAEKPFNKTYSKAMGIIDSLIGHSQGRKRP